MVHKIEIKTRDGSASERHWQTMLALFDATLRS